MIINGAYIAIEEVEKMEFESTIREYGKAWFRTKSGGRYCISCTVDQYNKALVDLEKAAKR